MKNPLLHLLILDPKTFLEKNIILPIRLSANFICNRWKSTAVAFCKYRTVRIGDVEIVGSVLKLQQREQTTADDGLSIMRNTDMMRVIAASWDISHIDKCTKGILQKLVAGRSTTCSLYIHHPDYKLPESRHAPCLPLLSSSIQSFFGLMLLGVKEGLSRGGKGACKIGSAGKRS